MGKVTFVVEYEDGKEPQVSAETLILGGKLVSVAWRDLVISQPKPVSESLPAPNNTVLLFDANGEGWLEITQFQGNNVDRLARIMTSNNQLLLDDYEKSQVVKGLHALNLDEAKIAKAVHESVHVVKQLLAIAYANHDVQELVKDGEVSSALVVARVEEHGEKAGEVLQKDLAKAKAAGKKKATKAGAIRTFGAADGKKLAELLSDAIPIKSGEHDHLVLRNGVKDDVMTLIALYMKE